MAKPLPINASTFEVRTLAMVQLLAIAAKASETGVATRQDEEDGVTPIPSAIETATRLHKSTTSVACTVGT